MNPNRESAISLTQFTNAYVPFAVLIALALMLPETTQNLNRYRTIYTIWATILLLIPALSLYVFSDASAIVYNYWHLFWTFSYLAFLFHFYWAVFVFYGGVRNTFVEQGSLIAGTNFLLTVWWGADVGLSWLIPPGPMWLRLERAAAHLFVFSIFVVTTLVLRPTPTTRALGLALTILVTASFVIWLFIRDWAPVVRKEL